MGVEREPYPEGGTVYARQGDTVDMLCARHLGAWSGVTEQVLDTNTGLADLGPVLPQGTPVHLPAPKTAITPQANTVKLWD